MSKPLTNFPVLAPLLRRQVQKSDPAPPPWAGLHPAAHAHRIIRLGTIAILVVFGGLGSWAALAPLAGAVIGQGTVKVDSNKKTVQHLEGGIVKKILVTDGDTVKQGQTLLVLKDAGIDADVEGLQGQLDAEMAKAARLRAERSGQDHISFPKELTSRKDDPNVATLMESETNYFNAQRSSQTEQIEVLKNQIVESGQQIENLKKGAEAEARAAQLLQQEIAANESLVKKQYVEKVHILALKREIEDYNSKRSADLANISSTQQHIADLKLRISSLEDQFTEDAAQKLTDSQATIFALQQKLRAPEDAKRRQNVVAPISGTVMNLDVFTIGGVIKAGQPLMDIVPENNDMIIETKIPVDDINEVHVGQKADVRLMAYKRRTTPLVDGLVTYVSPDSVTDPHGRASYYLTDVRITQESLKEAGNLKLYPGMPAEVFFRTEARTVLEYLLTPIIATARRSLREP